MKVILLKDVGNLGKEGDLREVKDGYGRNYLLPNKLALQATKVNLKKFDELKKKREKQRKKEEQSLAGRKDKIENLSLTITAEAKDDQTLYGGVTVAQIQKLLQEQGLDLEKDKIVLDESIDKVGAYKVPIKISQGLEANLRLWVVKK